MKKVLLFFSKENRSLQMSSAVTMLAGATNDFEFFAGTSSMRYTQHKGSTSYPCMQKCNNSLLTTFRHLIMYLKVVL
uniref:Putative ovule protein n=1 Tax=Solanum chacoense TaxID=4108 RepID=A0A0V0GKM4_SOLCH